MTDQQAHLRVSPDHRQRGAALLTVLLLVAVMATASALALERLTLAARLGSSAAAMAQARFHLLSAEQIALRRLAIIASADRTTLNGNWLGRAVPVPLAEGTAAVSVTDGGNCFNINALVSTEDDAVAAPRPVAMTQFITLMTGLGIDPAAAARIAAGATDRIDPDSVPSPGGEESGAPNAPLTDPAALSGLPGLTPSVMARLSPWLCALPTNDLAPININTLLPEQAALLQMLAGPNLSAAAARAQLAARPVDGFASAMDFWQSGPLRGIRVPEEAAQQVRIRTRWFRVTTTVRIGDVVLTGSSLFDSDATPRPRVVSRRWEESL